MGARIIEFWLENLQKWDGKPRRIGLKIKIKKSIFDIFQLRHLRGVYKSHLHSRGFHEVGFPSRTPGPAPALHVLLSQGVQQPAWRDTHFPLVLHLHLQVQTPGEEACGQMLSPVRKPILHYCCRSQPCFPI